MSPVSSVRDLGVYLDADLTMTTHVNATVRACFAALRQIRSVRRSLSFTVKGRFADAASCTRRQQSRLLQCSTVLAGISGSLLDRLQSVLNAAARLAFSARRSEHVTPLLRDLHWLKVPERIKFRLCVLTHRCLHGTAPPYLAETLQLTSDMSTRRHLRSSVHANKCSVTYNVPAPPQNRTV